MKRALFIVIQNRGESSAGGPAFKSVVMCQDVIAERDMLLEKSVILLVQNESHSLVNNLKR